MIEKNDDQQDNLRLQISRHSYGNHSENASVTSEQPLADDDPSSKIEFLKTLHDPKSLRKLHELGGEEELADYLHTNLKYGLNSNDQEDMDYRRRTYGKNKLPDKSQKGFLRLCFEAMKDKVLILLSVAAIVSLALGLYETFTITEYDLEGNPLPKVDWVEGVAIIVAILIVVLVGAANDFQKERQFRKLNAKKEDREVVMVREGQQHMVSIYEIVVGEIIGLETGDVVPADAVLIDGDVECDESSLTGETEPIDKKTVQEALQTYRENLPTDEDLGSENIKFKDPFLISGARVLSGRGTAVVTSVGENSMHGRMMANLSQDSQTTPLQERLDNLAEGISRYGFLAAVILFIILFIRFCVDIAPGGPYHHYRSPEKGKKFIDILITAITIVVVAVPEGLPLAVTLALAFATTRMAQNGNLVRILKSCETMGGATAICTDKTGTLTENKMRIVRGYFGYDEFDDTINDASVGGKSVLSNLGSSSKNDFCNNVILNSTAFSNPEYDPDRIKRLKQRPKEKSSLRLLFGNSTKEQNNNSGSDFNDEPYVGSKTEIASLVLVNECLHLFADRSLEEYRNAMASDIVQVIPFESSRKFSAIVVRIEGGFRVYFKGAAEILFQACGFQTNREGESIPMTRSARDDAWTKIDQYANDALRAVAFCHRDFVGIEKWPPSELTDDDWKFEANPDLLFKQNAPLQLADREQVLEAIVGIRDRLKEGIPEAVAKVKEAGVTVRMITGDNVRTAATISRGCNILTADDLTNKDAVIEGPIFRKMSEDEQTETCRNLKVMARSSPEDKRILVKRLMDAGEVVAVTGDGTNDAPALNLANVGFSMGINGTEVAREASDIILMTDDFSDIVQAIKWGRTVAISIKKFIQFQITVNITACLLTFVSAVASLDNHPVLTAVQLLWVNLIMDTLAALALATDKPDENFLRRKPAGRHTPLIMVCMWKMILGQAMTQLAVTFILHFAGHKLFFGERTLNDQEKQQLDALTFNTFVWLQFWKLFVTRKLDEADDITTVMGRITRENLDFFQHLFRNWYFVGIACIIGGFQVLIMFVGGAAFSIEKQTGGMWATAILCGFISIPIGLILRIIPNIWVSKIFPTKAFNIFIYYAGFHFIRRKKKSESKA